MALPDAIVAVITRGDEVLLIRRGATVPDPGVWAPISGKIEPRESQEDAVGREVEEEVGYGELTLSPREVAEARWVAASEIARIEPAFTVDREFFERVFPGLREEDHR